MSGSKRKLSLAFHDLPEDAESLSVTWRNGLYSDWSLCLGSRSFPVHKLALGSGERRSLLLVAAFKTPCAKTDNTDLGPLIPEPCWPFFEELLDYAYTGNLNLTIKNWAAMMKMADVLQMRILQELAIAAFDEILSLNTAFDACMDVMHMQLCHQVQEQVIDAAAEIIAPRFITGKCGDACPRDALLKAVAMHEQSEKTRSWPVELLGKVLKQETLEISSEDAVLDIVLGVVGVCRASDAELLRQLVRLDDLSPDKLLEACDISAYSARNLVLAALRRGFREASVLAVPPGLTLPLPRGAKCMGFPQGSFRVLIATHVSYQAGQACQSRWKVLTPKFHCSLLVFPRGTNKHPGCLGAYLTLKALQHAKWEIKGLKFSISLVWPDGTQTTQSIENPTFKDGKEDTGLQWGILTSDGMSSGTALHDTDKLCFEVSIDARHATGFS